jgi:DNA-binding Xre family transcriptional regulator
MAAIVKVTLKKILTREKITVYQLAQALTGQVSMNALYRWNSGLIGKIETDKLASIITALETLTGKDLSVNDLLEFKRGRARKTRGVA